MAEMGAADSFVEGGTLLDFSQKPVYIVRPPPRAVTDAELHKFLTRMLEVTRNHPKPSAMVLDLRHAAPMLPAQRRMITDSMKDQGEQLDNAACVALVFSSAIMRGFLTAMLWVFTPPYPVRVFEDVGEAISWSKEQLLNRREMLRQQG